MGNVRNGAFWLFRCFLLPTATCATSGAATGGVGGGGFGFCLFRSGDGLRGELGATRGVVNGVCGAV